VALDAGSKEAVDRIYKKAIELGGTDEGAPGQRNPRFYGGYFRDPDGNKLVAFVMG
jgi:predicted lactoylglutathione lyase